MSPEPPLVFYSRCKPCGVDAVEIARKGKRAFIGYSMRKAGVAYGRGDVREWMLDVSEPDQAEWEVHRGENLHENGRKNPQHAKNRNLAAAVTPGSIVLVPRPQEGVVYAGRVTGRFRVAYDADLSDEYLDLYRKAYPSTVVTAEEEVWLRGEVCQGWDVDAFVAIPLPQVPAWIRTSMFGRSTYGIVRGDDGGAEAYAAMDRLVNATGFAARPWSLDTPTIKTRLLETATPAIFEHLVVALLQLEFPEHAWLHVGGSGDGGLDGIAADDMGHVAGLLQCKLRYSGGAVFDDQTRGGPPTYLAYLRGPDADASIADHVLGPDRLVDLVKKHHARIPLATTLRVGPG